MRKLGKFRQDLEELEQRLGQELVEKSRCGNSWGSGAGMGGVLSVVREEGDADEEVEQGPSWSGLSLSVALPKMVFS